LVVILTTVGLTASALAIWSNCESCGLFSFGSMMRLIEKATSSAVSFVPSWNVTSSRIWNSIVLSSRYFQDLAICGTISPFASRVSRLSKILR